MSLFILFRKYTVFVLLLLLSGLAYGATKDATGYLLNPLQISSEARLSVLTVGPGNPLYAMFGHTAIRLQDPVYQKDIVYNYGTFDFETSFFALKFLYGNLNYFLSKSSFELFAKQNQALGRFIEEQVLNLSPKEIYALVKDMETELVSENRYYRYEFFSNNCTTKVRDLLARYRLFTPSQVTIATPTDTTFRGLLRPYLQRRPWIRFGINLLLGAPADYTADNWQQTYLPYMFYQSLSEAGLNNSDRPLVSDTRLLIPERPFVATPYWLSPVPVFWILLVFTALFTLLDFLNKADGKWLDRLLFGTVGLVGLILLPVSLLSLHEPLQPNWNLLWVLPTHLFIVVGVTRWQQKLWFRYYLWAALVLHASLLAGWYFIPQQLPEPVVLLVLALVIRITYRLFQSQQIPFRQVVESQL
tara:strand:- start:2742 stop:3989 length:1248 start_codon:yes stop_codon:yes gene_type:complete